MKVLAAICLVASVLASPLVLDRRTCDGSAEPSAQSIQDAINNWRDDVTAVNSFLNGIPSDTETLVEVAKGTLAAANDEPTQLAIFSKICDLTDSYNNAIATLGQKFPGVPQDLRNIINNPTDHGAVHASVADINHLRCCFVLPSLDNVWTAAAADYGLIGTVTTDVPRPHACASITC